MCVAGLITVDHNAFLGKGPRRHFSTRRLFFTLNAPCTPFAAMPATFLSPSLATTPSNVIVPFLTKMWIGLGGHPKPANEGHLKTGQ